MSESVLIFTDPVGPFNNCQAIIKWHRGMENMECEKTAMENIYYVVQIGLAAVILWYTWETRRLRITAEQQLAEQRRINELSLLPFFSPGINLFSSGGDNREAIKHFENDVYLPASIRQEYIKLLEQGTKIFRVCLKNMAPALGLDLQAVIYDGFTRNYIFGETGVTVSRQGEQDYIYSARDTYQTRNETIERLKAFYVGGEFLEHQLEITETNKNNFFMYVFGRTTGGRLFVFFREFQFKDGGITLKKVHWNLE